MCQGEKVTEVSQSQKKEEDLKRFGSKWVYIYVSLFSVKKSKKVFCMREVMTNFQKEILLKKWNT